MLESLFNGVAIKKRLQHKYFPVNIVKFLRIPILKNICERLHLIYFASISFHTCFHFTHYFKIQTNRKCNATSSIPNYHMN